MSVRSLLPSAAKQVVRKSLNAVGLTIAPEITDIAKKFSPDEADELNWIRAANIKTVLDIGAHAGETSRKMRSLLPEAFIYAFEPLREPYARLAAEMAGDDKFASFPLALGDRNERTDMNKNEFTQSSSLLEMTNRCCQEFPFTEKSEPESIEVRRLDDINLSMRENILVKIDTQGFEHKVIAGGQQTIRRSHIAIVEVSFVELYKDQPLFSAIYDQFRQWGFSYSGCLGQLRSPSDGIPLQADAIFRRAV